jgi:drug/metabolite transporter (DMT)-like permease
MMAGSQLRVVARTPVLIVLTAVGLNVLAGIILKTLANQANPSLYALAVGIGAVLMLHGLRMMAWLVAHRRFPLSSTYPLTSIFFPIMLGVSYAYGEPVGLRQLAGTALITAGIVWFTVHSNRHGT